jgi:histone acetyltransferase (RNA polymerase elongator complex component)
MYLKCVYFNYLKKKFFTKRCKTLKPGEFKYQFSDEDKFIDESKHRLLPLCIDTRPEYHNKNEIRKILLNVFSTHGKMNNSPQKFNGKPQVK